MIRFVLLLFFIGLCGNTYSQVSNPGIMDTLSGEKLNAITVSGYVDVYYGMAPGLDTKDLPYFVNMARLNEFSVNLAYLDLRYNAKSVRARFIPGFGSYMNANYAGEPGTLKNIVEASAGFRPFGSKKVWIDAGVFGSPFTNESAVSKDHLMYTRSLGPEYVPYYLAGIRGNWSLGPKTNVYVYLLNGWQQIADVNKSKSVAVQLEYRPDKKHLINFNTYAGRDNCAQNPDCGMRYFFDLYWVYSPETRLSCTSSLYFGTQNIQAGGPSDFRSWWNVNFVAKYRISSRLSMSARGEYFSDPHNIQVSTLTGSSLPFNTGSISSCINVSLSENALFRLEGRQFFSEKAVFPKTTTSKQLTWAIAGLTVWF